MLSDPQGDPGSSHMHYPSVTWALVMNVQVDRVTSAPAQPAQASTTVGKADTGLN